MDEYKRVTLSPKPYRVEKYNSTRKRLPSPHSPIKKALSPSYESTYLGDQYDTPEVTRAWDAFVTVRDKNKGLHKHAYRQHRDHFRAFKTADDKVTHCGKLSNKPIVTPVCFDDQGHSQKDGIFTEAQAANLKMIEICPKTFCFIPIKTKAMIFGAVSSRGELAARLLRAFYTEEELRDAKSLGNLRNGAVIISAIIELITSAQIGPEEQKAVLNATVLNELCKKYPPSVAYQKAFMKTLLHKLEESEVEMCDEIYEVYTDLLQQTEDEDDILCYKTYHLPNSETVSLQESIHLISQGTTGLNTWQAALHLAEWAFENSDLLENRKVLELGSGLGLTGIAICKQCKLRSLTFSDCHPQVLYLLMVNLEINFNSDPNSWAIKAVLPENQTVTLKRRKMIRSIRRQLSVKHDIGMEQSDIMEISCTSSASTDDLEEESDDELDIGIFTPDEEFWEEGDYAESYKLCCDNRVSLLQLDWSKGSHDFLDKLAPDIILAADVVYDKEVIPSLVRILLKVLKPKKNNVPIAYIASTVRNEDTRDFFLINLANEGLAYEMVEPPKEKTFHYDDIIPIEILRIHYSGT
ncbi:Hypothetical predicted protein [Mytilus galloprovincialis]|uniref:FAM86 N-terminal domain-containing protein n=1 Tax=Mytilus galloprovincialis TaxID=29158 RepID=A0A8B6CWN9_MYTGA|nr:Hypothetical predicted protein [Mytilus galloprovincialis]